MLTDIFVPLLTYPDATAPGALSEMLSLSTPFATSVTACAFAIEIPDLTSHWGAKIVNATGMASAVEADSRTTAEALVDDTATPANVTFIPTTSRVMLGQAANAAVAHALHHDLSMVALDPFSTEKRSLVESLIFGAGRPVMVVPEGVNGHWDLGKIAVAWDGGRSASRALHDAMPLLVKAGHAVLITAFDDKEIGKESVGGLASYLDRHGISSKHHDVSVAGKTVGAVLQQAALSQGAGLLVMGAFGHSRFRDFVLGGATQGTLSELRMPVFFSH